MTAVSDQTNAAIQPSTVHPSKRFNANIAGALWCRLDTATRVGRKYSAPRKISSSVPVFGCVPRSTGGAIVGCTFDDDSGATTWSAGPVASGATGCVFADRAGD